LTGSRFRRRERKVHHRLLAGHLDRLRLRARQAALPSHGEGHLVGPADRIRVLDRGRARGLGRLPVTEVPVERGLGDVPRRIGDARGGRERNLDPRFRRRRRPTEVHPGWRLTNRGGERGRAHQFRGCLRRRALGVPHHRFQLQLPPRWGRALEGDPDLKLHARIVRHEVVGTRCHAHTGQAQPHRVRNLAEERPVGLPAHLDLRHMLVGERVVRNVVADHERGDRHVVRVRIVVPEVEPLSEETHPLEYRAIGHRHRGRRFEPLTRVRAGLESRVPGYHRTRQVPALGVPDSRLELEGSAVGNSRLERDPDLERFRRVVGDHVVSNGGSRWRDAHPARVQPRRIIDLAEKRAVAGTADLDPGDLALRQPQRCVRNVLDDERLDPHVVRVEITVPSLDPLSEEPLPRVDSPRVEGVVRQLLKSGGRSDDEPRGDSPNPVSGVIACARKAYLSLQLKAVPGGGLVPQGDPDLIDLEAVCTDRVVGASCDLNPLIF